MTSKRQNIPSPTASSFTYKLLAHLVAESVLTCPSDIWNPVFRFFNSASREMTHDEHFFITSELPRMKN